MSRLWKFKQINPQKARGVLKEAYWSDPNWVVEIKHDGDRRIGQFCNECVRLTGTRESVDGTGFVEKTANVPHLSDFGLNDYAPRLRALDGTVLDGEIVAPHADDLPGGKSKYVTSIMGSSPEEAVRKQKERGWLEWAVFDCLWYKGRDVRDLSLHGRRTYMKQALQAWGNPYARVNASPFFVDNKKRHFEQIVRSGGEGVVLKHVDHTYGDEKLWVKVKGEWTADVVILGFKMGKAESAKVDGRVSKAKYANVVGSIRMGQVRDGKLWDCGFASGIDDALRMALTANPKFYRGRVMEITHNGREPSGAFRNPRFKRMRNDKRARDCTYDPDET